MSCVVRRCPVGCHIASQLRPGHMGWIHKGDFSYDKTKKVMWVDPNAEIRSAEEPEYFLLSRNTPNYYEIETPDYYEIEDEDGAIEEAVIDSEYEHHKPRSLGANG